MRNINFIKSSYLMILFFLFASATGWGQNQIIITQSSAGITQTGYDGGAERTWTQSGVSFGAKYVMKQSGQARIQLQANNGIVYNTTPIPGRIKSITINQNGSNTSTLYVGNTGRLVNNVTGELSIINGGTVLGSNSNSGWGSAIFDGENYSYFAIKRNGSAEYWNSLTITYEEITSEPTLTATPETLSGFAHYVGQGPSTTQSFTLKGINLDGTTDVDLVTGDGFEISLDNVSFDEMQTIPANTDIDQPIYVRLNGTTTGAKSGSILISGGDAEDIEVTLSGTVNEIPAAPSLTDATLNATYGSSFTHAISYTGAPTLFEVTDGELPAGLNLNATTGVISGTPTEVGTYLFEVTATDAFNQTGFGIYEIIVGKATQSQTFEDLTLAIDGEDVTLPETTNQGLAITYISSSPNVVSISGNVLSIVGVGTATITASNDGNENYLAFSTTFTVNVMDIYSGIGTFEKITSVEDLTDGYYVIANEFSEFMMTNGRSGSAATGFYVSAGLELEEGKVINPATSNVWKIQTNGSGKTIYNEVSGVYVGWSSGNSASAETIVSNLTRWTFAYADGKFTVNNVQETARQLSYNAGSPRFAAYSNNGQQELQLYKFIPAAPSEIIWDGAAWSNEVGPNENDDVIIDGALSLDGDLEVKNITVSENGSIVVNAGVTLTVNGAISNLGTADQFTVESDGNLLQTSTDTNLGDIVVKRVSEPMVRLNYAMWSSPVAGQNILAFSPETVVTRFYTYEGTATFVTVNDVANKTFDVARGYLIRTPNTWWENDAPVAPQTYLGQFVGTPNNGTQTLAIHADSYTSVGNPYPSNININEFFEANTGIGAIYLWKNNAPTETYGDAGGQYLTINELGDTSGNNIQNISVGQGFIVSSENGTDEVVFTNEMRTNVSAGFHSKGTNGVEAHRMWVSLNDENSTKLNQILVGYASNATNDIDANYDSKLLNPSGSYIYSNINEEAYAIQGRALPFDAQDVVALGVNIAEAGRYTISLNSFDGLFVDGDTTIYLKDKSLDVVHNLMESAYTFEAVSGVDNTRFEIIYTTEGEMGVSDLTKQAITIYAVGNDVNILSKDSSIKSVQIFDMQGRNIHTASKVNANQLTISTIAKGVLVVKVETANGKIYNQKVIVK